MADDTTWTEHDDALSYSCGGAAELFVHRRWPVPVPVRFARRFAGPEERILAPVPPLVDAPHELGR